METNSPNTSCFHHCEDSQHICCGLVYIFQKSIRCEPVSSMESLPNPNILPRVFAGRRKLLTTSIFHLLSRILQPFLVCQSQVLFHFYWRTKLQCIQHSSVFWISFYSHHTIFQTWPSSKSCIDRYHFSTERFLLLSGSNIHTNSRNSGNICLVINGIYLN